MAYIEKRGENKYKARIYVKGEGKRWLRGYFATEAEARVAAAEAVLKARPRSETVGEFALRWVKDYPRKKASSRSYYEGAVKRIAADKRLIGPGVVLADLPLGEVTRPIARAYVLQRKHLHQPLSAMFTDALNDGLVEANPFHRLNVPQSRGRKDILPLTREEVGTLAETATDVWPGRMGKVMRGLIYFQAFVGCRNGEAFAVRWSWLHLDDQEVELRGALYNGVEDSTKSGKPRRVVFPPPAHEPVLALRPDSDHPRVFTTENGGSFNKSQFYRYWHPIRCAFEAQLPDWRRRELAEARGKAHLDFYELRHFCATYLLEQGMTPEDVAFQLGHQDGGVLVVQRYGHPSEDARRERIKAVFA